MPKPSTGKTSTIRMQSSVLRIVLGAICLATVSPITFGHDHGGHSHDHDHRHGGHAHDHDDEHSMEPRLVSGDPNSTNSTSAPAGRSSVEAYIYGTLSATVVSLLSLAGVMILPFLKRKAAYNSVMLLFMSLAVGTMTSDAVLHLIPEALGLHSHDHDHSHDHEEDSEGDKPYLGKLVLVLATLYFLYLLELAVHVVPRLCKKRSAVHDACGKKGASPKSPSKDAEKAESGHDNTNAVELKSMKDENAHGHGHGHGHSHSPNGNVSPGGAENTPQQLICGLTPMAFMMTASDALHNFTDGLAIGAAFAKSAAAGVAVSIAVVCHELPHEVGDFAVLLNTGTSVKRALLINFISALTCFLGVYPGIIAGQQENVRQWVFAIVAGGFLYVALVHMIREIKDFGALSPSLSIILQNTGLLLGFVVVLLLAIYEDRMSAAI